MNSDRESRVKNPFLTSKLIEKNFSLNPWLHLIFDKYTLKPIYKANSHENFDTVTPTIKENYHSKFNVSNKEGYPV